MMLDPKTRELLNLSADAPLGTVPVEEMRPPKWGRCSGWGWSRRGLAPEHLFPVALDDALATTRWVGKHGVEVGGDPARVALAGEGAGGNLSAVTALGIHDGAGARRDVRLAAGSARGARSLGLAAWRRGAIM